MPTSKSKKSITPGQVVALGKHRLMCGDALDADHVRTLVHNTTVNLICTDVPYGVSYVENKATFKQQLSKNKIIANDAIADEEAYTTFSAQWLECIKPFLAEYNTCYIFNADKMLFALRQGMLQAGWRMAQILIWIKNSAVIGRLDYLPQHEFILYGWYGKHCFRKSKDKSVLVYPRPSKSSLHPTMKPLGLMRRLILNSTNLGEVVYDGFMGSGSCLIACEQTGRVCYGMEIDPEYCQVVIDRYEQMTGNTVRLITKNV